MAANEHSHAIAIAAAVAVVIDGAGGWVMGDPRGMTRNVYRLD